MKATDSVFPTESTTTSGITVRDYIAIQVITGLSANSELNDRGFGEIADIAYRQADAMIKRSETHE